MNNLVFHSQIYLAIRSIASNEERRLCETMHLKKEKSSPVTIADFSTRT